MSKKPSRPGHSFKKSKSGKFGDKKPARHGSEGGPGKSGPSRFAREDKSESRGGGGGFEIRDRSGRVHKVGTGGGASHGSPRAEEPRRTITPRSEESRRGPSPHVSQPSKRLTRDEWREERSQRDARKGHHGSRRDERAEQPREEKQGRGARRARKHDRRQEEERPRGGGFRRDDRGAQRAPKKGPFGGDREQRGPHRDDRRPKPEAGRAFAKKSFQRDGRSSEHRERDQANAEAAAGGKLKATVDKNRKGFGFLIFDNRQLEDAFIPPRAADELFHGDRVNVTLNKRGEVIDIEVLQHRFRELVGKYFLNPSYDGDSKGAWVVYERKRAREEIFIPKPSQQARSGDWIRAKLHFHEEGPYAVTAEVVEVYGAEVPAAADISIVAAEYNLIEEHSPAAVKEAEAFKLTPADYGSNGRVDLRDMPFITIDGETARDFDDAVYVERDGSGYILWVAIADVSHYVTPGSALDEEAYSRGTSVYFPERAFHMLPHALSTNLCSLRPNEPRLAMVSKIYFDHAGKRLRTELMEATIESKRRATYTQIQEEWEANQSDPDFEYKAHFELYQLLRKARNRRGSIDFDLPEAKILVDDVGEPQSIVQLERKDAHRLIEEFMIGANEAVTDWATSRNWPFIFRVHDLPAEQALMRFSDLAATVGIAVVLDEENLNQSLAEVIQAVQGHPASELLNTAMLRSMKTAVYSSIHDIHFGLASPGYTHFTSPIRRYPDLVVHRILRMALRAEEKRGPALNPKTREQLEQLLEETAEHCSFRERLATEADREATKLKQVRYMTRHVGEEFDGKIIGLLESGFFVQLFEPYVEGMVSVDTLDDDYYAFDQDKMVLVGRRTRRVFRTGDKVRVNVTRASIDERKIDFTLLDHMPSDIEPLSQSKGKNKDKNKDKSRKPKDHKKRR